MLLAVCALVSGCSGGPLGLLLARLEVRKGNQSYLKGDFADAVQHYENALKHHPHYSLADLNLAYSYTNLFRLTQDPDERKRLGNEATRCYSGYLAHLDSNGPASDRIQQHMLTLFLDSGQPEKAVSLLQERLQKNPGDLAALQMLSNIKSDLGDVEGALDLFRKRIELAPDNPETHHSLAVFAWSVSYNSREPDSLRARAIVDEGIHAAEEAMRLKSEYFEAITYANLLYREKAKFTDSMSMKKHYQAKADSLRQYAMKIRPAS